ncbi:hypothetical protein VC566_00810 [Citrobacter freundii]|nr:hypothetical protein [Citrobacter freundii]
MREVKTYAVNCNDAWLNTKGDDISDSYVKYADYLELAVQLANAESKCRELAAENAGLKNPDNWLSQSDYGYEASEVATQNGATEDESLRAGMIAIINRIGTPATDAFLAEVRAQGVERMIEVKQQQLDGMHPDTFAIGAVRDSIRRDIYELKVFAEILRQEAAQ